MIVIKRIFAIFIALVLSLSLVVTSSFAVTREELEELGVPVNDYFASSYIGSIQVELNIINPEIPVSYCPYSIIDSTSDEDLLSVSSWASANSFSFPYKVTQSGSFDVYDLSFVFELPAGQYQVSSLLPAILINIYDSEGICLLSVTYVCVGFSDLSENIVIDFWSSPSSTFVLDSDTLFGLNYVAGSYVAPTLSRGDEVTISISPVSVYIGEPLPEGQYYPQPSAFESSEVLTGITDMVDASTGWVGSFLDGISKSPLLLLFVITTFVSLGISIIALVKRK